MPSKWGWILGAGVVGGACLIIAFMLSKRPDSSTSAAASVSVAPTTAPASTTSAGPESFVLGDKIAAPVLPAGHAVPRLRAKDAARDRDARVDMADRLLAIRALDATPGNESLKAFFHAAVPVWSEQDRPHWADAVSAAEVEYATAKAKKD